MRLALGVAALIAFLAIPHVVRRPLLATGSSLALGTFGVLSLVGITASVIAVLGIVVAPEPLPVLALGGAIDACVVGLARLLSHPLRHWPSILAAVVLVALVARLVIAAIRTARDAHRARPSRHPMPGEAEAGRRLLGQPIHGVRVLPSAAPVAYTTGLLRPQTVVSSGLLQALDERERLAVIAHERAHANRTHITVLFLAASLGRAFWFVPGVGLAVGYVALALETAADDGAVRALGNPVEVARAIASAARLGAHTPGLGVGITGSDVALRVHRLVHSARPRWPVRAGALALVALAALVMLAVAWSSASGAITRERAALAQHEVCHLPHPPTRAA